MSQVTLKFISEKSGVSTTIVSKILNNKEVRVSKEKRELVIEIARKYNYVPNLIAASLVTKKSKMIGLLIPDISNTFFSDIAKNIEAILSKEGYNLIFCNTNDSYELQEKYANLLLGRGVDALIFCLAMGTRERALFIERFIEHDIPLVAFDRFKESDKYSSVSIDNKLGIYEAVNYLYQKGHRKIGCIAGPKFSTSSNVRLEGFIESLERLNIDVDESLIAYGDYRFEGGYEACLKILEQDITSIMVFNDLMAYGAYKAISDKGLKVPEDISIVGFDNLMFSQMLSIPLTTVAQNTKELSASISTLVLESVENKDEKKHILIKPELIIRDSVKDIK